MSIESTTPDARALLEFTVEIVAAHVSNNNVAGDQVPELISIVHGALSALGAPAPAPAAAQEPAVSIKSSVKPDYIVCLEDGAKLKMLKRYIRTRYDLSPDEYRRKWGLASDYPMVAPSYAEKRRTLAHAIGLGRKAPVAPAASVVETGAVATPKATHGRPRKTDAAASAEKPARRARAPKSEAA